jgi:hypothetical protein
VRQETKEAQAVLQSGKPNNQQFVSQSNGYQRKSFIRNAKPPGAYYSF